MTNALCLLASLWPQPTVVDTVYMFSIYFCKIQIKQCNFPLARRVLVKTNKIALFYCVNEISTVLYVIIIVYPCNLCKFKCGLYTGVAKQRIFNIIFTVNIHSKCFYRINSICVCMKIRRQSFFIPTSFYTKKNHHFLLFSEKSRKL